MRYDYHNTIEGAKILGREMGLAEGEAKAQTEMARKMLAASMPLEQIMQFTGLDAETIEVLTAAQ